jgi:hypothetical protein
MLRTIVFFCLITSTFASETFRALVNASAGFSAAIQQQLALDQGDLSATEFAQKTIDYAEARGAYFKALRAEVPELMKIHSLIVIVSAEYQRLRSAL